MIAPPSPHAAAAIVLTTLMFYGFAAGRIKIEIISLLTISAIALGLYSFPLPGQQATDGLKLAFEGFGHYALITICALMIMGRGLVVTGALEPVARFLTRIWRYNQRLGFLVTLLLAMLLSMMVNDTPVLVLLLPILVTLAERGGMPASRTLIPVNSAVLIGGMATTIGTSTNLLVVSIARDLGMREITVFHFTPIVLIAAAVALPFIWLVMPRLLPDNSKEAGHSSRRFYADLRIRAGSPALGRRAGDILRGFDGEVRLISAPNEDLAVDDRIGIVSTHEMLEDVMRIIGASSAPAALMDRIMANARATRQDVAVVELAIAADSRFGRTTRGGERHRRKS